MGERKRENNRKKHIWKEGVGYHQQWLIYHPEALGYSYLPWGLVGVYIAGEQEQRFYFKNELTHQNCLPCSSHMQTLKTTCDKSVLLFIVSTVGFHYPSLNKSESYDAMKTKPKLQQFYELNNICAKCHDKWQIELKYIVWILALQEFQYRRRFPGFNYFSKVCEYSFHVLCL